MSILPKSSGEFAELQGLIRVHICLHQGQLQATAQADMQRIFKVTAPTIHNMVLKLEKEGLIRRQPRQPRQARSLELLIAPEDLTVLR